ncbi:uncharacterized protein LOC141664593 [Apium graveolens]|uniref:uncharacterized protein LOC141664593 n=1 Tax=Apium graveolens TaxID=4045 RepID=UPI003D7BE9C0
MKARNFPSCDFLQAKIGANPNYMRRSILAAQELVCQGSRKCIGNGEDTAVWGIPWLPCKDNGYLMTEMPHQLEDIRVVNFLKTGTYCWDDEVVNDICNGIIQGEQYWELASFWKNLWSLELPGKVINFVWRQANISKITSATYMGDIMEFFHQLSTVCSREKFMLILMICWNLWHRRNRWVWDKISISEFGVYEKAMNMLFDWKQRCLEFKIHKGPSTTSITKWKPPQQGWVKINTDVAVFVEAGYTGI